MGCGEGGVVGAGRVGRQGQRGVAKVREHRRSDPGVVVDDRAVGEAGLGVEDLLQVGKLELAPLDDDLDGLRLWDQALRRLRAGLAFSCSCSSGSASFAKSTPAPLTPVAAISPTRKMPDMRACAIWM